MISSAVELRRIYATSAPVSNQADITVAFLITCRGPASDTLQKSRSIMKLLLEHSQNRWPTDEEWFNIFPEWFTSQFIPQPPKAELVERLNQWRQLPWEERRRDSLVKQWSLHAWMFAMAPREREWRWMSAQCIDEKTIHFCAEFQDWPAGWAQLEWLFLACGASSIDEANA